MKKTILLVICIMALFSSCKSDRAAKSDSVEDMADAVALTYELIAFKPSTSYSDAAINGVKYADGKFDFDVSGTDYVLGEQTPDAPQKMCANSGQGQHIHLILNDEPYAAKYTNAFDYEVPDGEHYMLAFLSRSYHESIKTDAAHVAKKVTILDNGITEAKPISEPVLFYSRPKGTYVGKAETDKVMLDFYGVNTNIGTTQKVQAEINGETHLIDKWQPYYITGLPMGENTVTLTLVDLDGNKIDTPLNPVTRTFTLQADPMEN